MSDATLSTRRDKARATGAALDLSAEYQPDEAAQARALLLIMGLPEEEIERIISEITLESDREM